MTAELRVALVQMDCSMDNYSENLEKAGGYIARSKEKDADLVVLPELFNVGYDLSGMHKWDQETYEKTRNYLKNTAKESDIYIIAGVLEIDNEKYYNSVLVINNNGELVAKYRKIHLFPLTGEDKIFTAGEEIVSFEVKDFLFGIMICYDIRFPEQSMAFIDKNCSGIIVAAAFPYPRLDHWNVLLRARAIENQMYVLACNRTGGAHNLKFFGSSAVIDPWGKVLSQAREDEESLLIDTVDIKEVEKVRNALPCRKVHHDPRNF